MAEKEVKSSWERYTGLDVGHTASLCEGRL